MNSAANEAVSSVLENKLSAFMKVNLKLGDDVQIDPSASLIDQIGLDSIEAFDAVATLHDIMGVTIPDDFNPKVIATLRDLGQFMASRYEPADVEKFLQFDLSQLALSEGLS